MRSAAVKDIYIFVRRLHDDGKDDSFLPGNRESLLGELRACVAEEGEAEASLDGQLKAVIALAIANTDRVTFERVFALYLHGKEGFKANDFTLPESQEKQLWDLYADVRDWGGVSAPMQEHILNMLLQHTKSYFQENFYLRSRGHMVKVFDSFVERWSQVRAAGDAEAIRVLDRFALQMPFSSRCLYERKVRGRSAEVFLYLSYVGTATLFALLLRFLYPAAISFKNCMALLPTIIGFFGKTTGFIFSILSWVPLGPFGKLLSGAYTYVIAPACWGINVGMIAPILFVSAWVLPIYGFFKLLEFGFANLFSSPPDFEAKQTPSLSQVFPNQAVTAAVRSFKDRGIRSYSNESTESTESTESPESPEPPAPSAPPLVVASES